MFIKCDEDSRRRGPSASSSPAAASSPFARFHMPSGPLDPEIQPLMESSHRGKKIHEIHNRATTQDFHNTQSRCLLRACVLSVRNRLFLKSTLTVTLRKDHPVICPVLFNLFPTTLNLPAVVIFTGEEVLD